MLPHNDPSNSLDKITSNSTESSKINPTETPKLLSQREHTIPSSTATFGVDITVCREIWDWDTYIRNGGNSLESPRSKSPLNQLVPPGSNIAPNNSAGSNNGSDDDISTINRINKKPLNKLLPYISQGCLRQKRFTPTEGAKYSEFEEGNTSTKVAFGNDPVLGIYENSDFPAQGNLGNINRSVITGLNSIFTIEQLKEIYSTGGSRTGMPRVFSTGPDKYTTTNDGQKTYQGGWCSLENGQIFVRTSRVGNPFDPSLYGRNVTDPWRACARKGKKTVEDRNLQIYQFVYELRYPTVEQCKKWFSVVSSEECTAFYRNRYGRDIAGNTSGNRLITVLTYYGTFDDQYTKWVGWVNPEFHSSRSKSSDEFIRGYDGYLAFVLN